MLSSHLFFCLPHLLIFFTVPSNAGRPWDLAMLFECSLLHHCNEIIVHLDHGRAGGEGGRKERKVMGRKEMNGKGEAREREGAGRGTKRERRREKRERWRRRGRMEKGEVEGGEREGKSEKDIPLYHLYYILCPSVNRLIRYMNDQKFSMDCILLSYSALIGKWNT